jgi:hypothetical protein
MKVAVVEKDRTDGGTCLNIGHLLGDPQRRRF